MKSNPNGGKNTPKIHIDAETKTKIELWIVNNIATAEEAKSLNMGTYCHFRIKRQKLLSY